MYRLFCVVLCTVCVYMCTVLLPPGGYPIAVKYIILYHIIAGNVQFVCRNTRTTDCFFTWHDGGGAFDLVKDEINRQLQAKWADKVRGMYDVGIISAVSFAVQDCAPQAAFSSSMDTHSRCIHTDIGKGIFTALFLSSNRYARHSRRTIEKKLLATILK
jgi:hypothetical protein